MKKIYNDRNLVKILKKIKKEDQKANIFKFTIPVGLLFFCIALFIYEISTGIYSLSTIICFSNLFAQCFILHGKTLHKKNTEKINKIEKKIHKVYDEEFKLVPKKVEIIPRNLKIGEDLTHKNIIPIFVEGKFIIIKESPYDYVMFQHKEDDKDVVYILEDEEVENVLLDLDEGKKILSLENK